MTGASRTATNFACQLADGHDRRQMARTGCARNASCSARQTRKTGSRQYDWGSKNPQSTPLPSFPDLTRAAARQGPVFRRCDLNSQSRPHCCRSSAPRIAVPMTGSKHCGRSRSPALGDEDLLSDCRQKPFECQLLATSNSRTRPVSDIHCPESAAAKQSPARRLANGSQARPRARYPAMQASFHAGPALIRSSRSGPSRACAPLQGTHDRASWTREPGLLFSTSVHATRKYCAESCFFCLVGKGPP